MRRFGPRIAAALIAFAVGVLLTAVRNELRFSEWFLDQPSTTADVGTNKCSEKWENVPASSKTLGWDLTYLSVMTKVKLCPGNEFCEEWKKPGPPIHNHISQWQGDPIISSFAIEYADGHVSVGAEWFVRTKDHAYQWFFYPLYPLYPDFAEGKRVISTQAYDEVFDKISCWLQLEPEQRKFGPHGYVGFLSIYEEGKSRQMLLTFEDFIKGGEYPDDNVQPGPFTIVLDPIISPVREAEWTIQPPPRPREHRGRTEKSSN